MDKPKRVLIMRGYFPPESAASNQMCLDMIKKLGEKGMEVTVACPIPTRGVTNEIRKEYRLRKKEKLYENVTIRRYWIPRERNNTLLRAVRYFLQNIYQFFFGLRTQYDVLFLYSTPPTNGLVGGLLSKVKKKPFMYYLHDIFPDSLAQAGLTKKGSLIWKIGRVIENLSYRNACHVLTISQSMRNNIIQKGVPECKTSVIPNWVNTDKVMPIERKDNSLIAEFSINPNAFIVTYAGNIGEHQSVETLVHAAKLLENEKNILFVIIGDGSEKENCINLAHGLKNILFLPMQAPERIAEVYSLGDISTVLCKKGVGQTGMPSKTGSIFASETMILAAFDIDSDLGRIINENELGICVEPENAEALATEIKWASKNIEMIKDKATRGRAYLMANMTAEICTEKLWRAINSQ